MALDYFVTKFYKFPYIDKPALKTYFLSDEIDMWCVFTLLVPMNKGKDILVLLATNNLSIFDKIESELLAVEIDVLEYSKAAKWWGIEYQSFYPSADISDFSG